MFCRAIKQTFASNYFFQNDLSEEEKAFDSCFLTIQTSEFVYNQQNHSFLVTLLSSCLRAKRSELVANRRLQDIAKVDKISSGN